MKDYTSERFANIMSLNTASIPALFQYLKPTVRNCMCTFADGTIYWQKVIANDRYNTFKSEANKLYLDEECTILANVTRIQKINECKKSGLI